MIDRYALFRINDLQERFHLVSPIEGVERSYNISPTQLATVIVERHGIPSLEQMRWGLIPAGARDVNSVFRYKTFNVRSEGIFSKAQWSESIRHRRCLVPANGFYMWQMGLEKKTPYYVHLSDQELFSFAGIYSSWQDADGRVWNTYSLVTVDVDDVVRGTSRRMPVILLREDEATWLDPDVWDAGVLYNLMRPYSREKMQVYEVSSEIKSMKINHPRLITPIKKGT